jgi:predicted ATPase
MITLNSIAIEGYKSIAKAEVELRDLNVIVGANGSGKSNFIGVFKLLKAISTTTLQNHISLSSDRFLHHGKKITQQIKAHLFMSSGDYEIDLVESKNRLLIDRENIFTDYDVDVTSQVYPIAESSLFAHSGALFRSASDKNLLRQISKMGIYHFHDATENAAVKQVSDLHDNRSFRADAKNLAAYLYLLQQNHPHSFSRIQDCIRLVAPYFEHFILEPQEIKGGFIKLEWKQKGSDAYFDAYSLSDGTLRFICLATLLMQPEPPTLILLDEPELGLHPYAIALLAEMLESAAVKSQVIIATQSVTLLNWMKPENIIVAEHDGLATTFNRPELEKLLPWLDDFSMGDIWEKNLIGGRP